MSEPADELEIRLVQALENLDHELQSEWDASPAAVLVPLYRDSGEWHLLFTRRTDDVDVHRGQVSFPGGRIEDDDASAAQAALREAEEEIGLRPADVTILGELNPLMTVSQFVVTPVVGSFPWPYQLKANTSEVARCFGVPIQWLVDPSNLEVEYRQPLVPGPKIAVYYFKPFDDEVIWGVTARITLGFLEILKSEP
jgi:8-oxo-dGTP pyrophosphatase MutT (NUDIX family)